MVYKETEVSVSSLELYVFHIPKIVNSSIWYTLNIHSAHLFERWVNPRPMHYATSCYVLQLRCMYLVAASDSFDIRLTKTVRKKRRIQARTLVTSIFFTRCGGTPRPIPQKARKSRMISTINQQTFRIINT